MNSKEAKERLCSCSVHESEAVFHALLPFLRGTQGPLLELTSYLPNLCMSPFWFFRERIPSTCMYFNFLKSIWYQWAMREDRRADSIRPFQSSITVLQGCTLWIQPFFQLPTHTGLPFFWTHIVPYSVASFSNY